MWRICRRGDEIADGFAGFQGSLQKEGLSLEFDEAFGFSYVLGSRFRSMLDGGWILERFGTSVSRLYAKAVSRSSNAYIIHGETFSRQTLPF